ncbi:MAG: dienelactone hydrolase family protein [Rhodospirillales bacterium]|nr:dienelactone hydrolase family protein [Rhodospirillales bacterium]
MPGTEIRIKAEGGKEFMAYLSMPRAGRGPGVVVIQEIFGVNQVMRDVTDWIASEGYMALCPDLFWRQQPGIQLTDRTDKEWARAFELFGGFDVDKGVADLGRSIDSLRAFKGSTGKIGTIGFCLGGRLAFLTAARTKTDAAVGYYGVALKSHLKEKIAAPLLLHVAADDQFVPKDEQREIHAVLDGNKTVTIHDYPGTDHAFARVGGKHYDKAAAELAHRRSLEFLGQHLG